MASSTLYQLQTYQCKLVAKCLSIKPASGFQALQFRQYKKWFPSQQPSNVYQAKLDLYPLRFALQESRGYIPTLSPSQVSSILYMNEASVEGRVKGLFPVKGFDSNQLGSNSPVEDRRAVARILQDNASIFGVFDGHAGTACAQAISERLFDYIAVSLLTSEKLEKFNSSLKTDNPINLLQWYIFNNDYINTELSTMYRNSLQKFVTESLSTGGLHDDEPTVTSALHTGFTQLDFDISGEAKPLHGTANYDALMTALSGSCASVAHVSCKEIHVANIGDTRAVIGRQDDEGNWTAIPLSNDHNTDNDKEVDRLKKEHPKSEHNFMFKNGRLLGELVPLRAFGDIRYKWNIKDLQALKNYVGGSYSYSLVPGNYYTPPYLTAEPEIFHHKLTVADKFMVLATDGLWECLSNEEVVQMVGFHRDGKSTQDKFELTDHSVSLADINSVLKKRKSGLAHKAVDQNAATHLIRNALGPEHRKLSEMLTFPPDIIRHYRDDITIIVVYFDEKYLAKE